MINASEIKKVAHESVNKALLEKAIERCEADIKEMASRGCNSLSRNAYSCYIGCEDSGVKDALVAELEKSGFKVYDHQCSYWVGAINISW